MSSIDWTATADLHRIEWCESAQKNLPRYLPGRDKALAGLVSEIMEMREPDRRSYSIMVGANVYRYSDIKRLYRILRETIGATYKSARLALLDILLHDYVDEQTLRTFKRRLNRCPLDQNAYLNKVEKSLARYGSLKAAEERLPDYLDAQEQELVEEVNVIGEWLLRQYETFEKRFKRILRHEDLPPLARISHIN